MPDALNPGIAYLERMLATHASETLQYQFARAKLSALLGNIAEASAALQGLLLRCQAQIADDDFIFTYALHVSLLTYQLDAAADAINRRFRTDNRFRVVLEKRDPSWLTVVDCRIGNDASILFSISDELRALPDRFDFIINRWVAVLPIFAEYLRQGVIETGEVHVNLDDHGIAPGLAFCDNRPEYFLIPDPPYLGARGYEQVRAHYARNDVAWEQRRPVAMWRGGTSGQPADRRIGWRTLPRIRLCEIGREHPDIIDAGITGIAQMPNAQAEEEIRNSGLMAGFLPVNDFNKYRYQIDIDGNSNSWPGLFQKLLTGSPVLKVASPRGFRQWYYDRLKPWINFVPVAVDMSDLVEKAEWLKAHDDAAHQIGQRGRALAESLDYPGELKSSGRTIGAALRHFSGRPEAVLRFGTTEDANVHLGDGWLRPEAGGVAAVAWESRLELPRPIAVEDFVLTLDVSPVAGPAMPATQRLSVLANGEILRQATLSERQEVHCILPRRVIDQAEKLAITLLHPDGVCSASAARPLDMRVLSVTLHRLELTPVSVHGAATAATTAPAVPATPPTRPTRQGAVMRALYGRDIWHGFAPSGPRAPEVQGWNGRYPVFGRLLEEIPNPTMIDVAVWKGQSTIFVAELMRRRRIDGCVVAVDTFLAEDHWPSDGKLYARHPGGRPDVYETFLDNVFFAGVADLVVPLPAHSVAAARILAQRGVKAGLIHLDASRDYAGALRDAEAYWPLVEPGGYLVGDDYGPTWPGVVKAADEFAAKVGLELQVHSPKWLLRKPVVVPPKPAAPPDVAAPGTSREASPALPSSSATASETPRAASWDRLHAIDLGSTGRVDELNELVAACFGTDFRIRIEVDDNAEYLVSSWEIVASDESRVLIGRKYDGYLRDQLHCGIFDTIPLIAAYHRRGTPYLGRIAVNLEDFGLKPGLAYSDYRPEYFLMPDYYFLGTQGYARLRHGFAAAPVAWEDRMPTVLWRGADFGPKVADWRELPRVKLCEIANRHGTLFDVGINTIRHGVFTEEIKASGLMRDSVPNYHFNRYRAHIDIDGRSNSWPGLFQKLLSGSPVLKVPSPLGYRQWYYDRLVPWVHYVSVATDMSDLQDKAAWILAHDSQAKRIGEAGRALAEAITYETASDDALLAFTAAFQAVQS
jgi:hypothetical protein